PDPASHCLSLLFFNRKSCGNTESKRKSKRNIFKRDSPGSHAGLSGCQKAVFDDSYGLPANNNMSEQ
ncbi:MAG: hypothetical protein OXF74_08350, partial [Rhodobacteraceae bacterium]|nr:hypothetical protein [Paracoccaceae bacterium]